MRGTHLLMSKACKNSARARQCEDKVPFKAILPLRLRDRVSGKSKTEKDKGCLHEISLVIACLTKNNYENKNCQPEIDKFNQCYSNHLNNKNQRKRNREKGVLTPNVKTLNHLEVNMLLKKFPQL